MDLCGSEYRILAGVCVDTVEPSLAIVTSYSDITWLGFNKFLVLQITPVKTGVAVVHERRKQTKQSCC